MIALLFVLLSVAMLLTYYDRLTLGYVVFVVSVALGTYWLKFHATSQLQIQL